MLLEASSRLRLLHGRPPRTTCSAATPASVRRAHPGDRRADLARPRHRRLGDRATRRRCSRPAARSRPFDAAASRSCARPATTLSPSGRWASACSTTLRVAARWAQAELGLDRLAIVDFDVHHGNGTEAIFRDDDDRPVRSRCTSGRSGRAPAGPDDQAETTTSTCRCAAGAGDDEYLRVFERVVEPALARFEPELVLVSAGFDAHVDDPLADIRVTEEGFPRARAPLRRRRRRAARPCSRAGTTWRRCRASSARRWRDSGRKPVADPWTNRHTFVPLDTSRLAMSRGQTPRHVCMGQGRKRRAPRGQVWQVPPRRKRAAHATSTAKPSSTESGQAHRTRRGLVNAAAPRRDRRAPPGCSTHR